MDLDDEEMANFFVNEVDDEQIKDREDHQEEEENN